MLRSLAVPPLLLMLLMTTSLNTDARTIKVKIPATTEPVDDTTYMHLPDGTITVDIDSDEILTTSPESETFSEPSPLELTEEPLPDSVVRQQEKELAQEVQAKEELTRKPIDSEKITTEESTTEKKSSRKGYRFGATTSMPVGFSGFYTVKPEYITTENIADTTEYEDFTTVKHHFKRPARPARLDLEMSENRMETTTDYPVLQNKKQDYYTSPILIMTTDSANSVPTQSPLFRFFTTTTAKPLFMEPQPETTTMWPESRKEEATTIPVLKETTELPLSSSTQDTRSITEPAETSTIHAPSTIATTGPEPLTARMELYMNIQYPVSEFPETTIATSAPEITTVPESTILTISAPETTTSTTSVLETTTLTTSAPDTTTSTSSAPETTTSTSSAPETTTSTSSAPETTSSTSFQETTTSTFSAPETTTPTTSAPESTTSTSSAPETTTSTTSVQETTTSTTSAPETQTPTSAFSAPLATIPSIKAPETTTTTPRPVLTRAPRVERIFNSDGVEVLYGYSSVVRTNRS